MMELNRVLGYNELALVDKLLKMTPPAIRLRVRERGAADFRKVVELLKFYDRESKEEPNA